MTLTEYRAPVLSDGLWEGSRVPQPHFGVGNYQNTWFTSELGGYQGVLGPIKGSAMATSRAWHPPAKPLRWPNNPGNPHTTVRDAPLGRGYLTAVGGFPVVL